MTDSESPLVFQSRSVSGRRGENESLVTVDFATRTVRLMRTHVAGDRPGAPIGRFESVVDESALSSLRKALETDALEKLGPASGGGPGTTLFVLSIARGNEKLSRRFTSRDIAHISAVRAHLDAASALAGLAAQSPVAAVEVETRREGEGFLWTLSNVGREPIRVPHPLRPELARPVRMGVRVSSFPEPKPGTTAPPLAWEQLALAPVTEDEEVPEWLELAPGQSWSRPTLAWKPRQSGRHLAQGVWEGVEKTSEREPMVVWGTAFSKGLELTP